MKPVEVIRYDEKASRPSPPASTPSRYPRTCRPRRSVALLLRQGSMTKATLREQEKEAGMR